MNMMHLEYLFPIVVFLIWIINGLIRNAQEERQNKRPSRPLGENARTPGRPNLCLALRSRQSEVSCIRRRAAPTRCCDGLYTDFPPEKQGKPTATVGYSALRSSKASSPARSGGGGAEKCSARPVAGWRKPRVAAWSACRGKESSASRGSLGSKRAAAGMRRR